jgi:hypothetical protein
MGKRRKEMIEEEILTEELPPEQSPETPPETLPEVTQEAIDTGWIPKDDFKGDKSKWRPAEEWVERGRTLIPIIKTQLRGTETKLEKALADLERQRKTTEKLLKMSETVGQEAYDRAKRELTQKQVQAVVDGDVETWQKLEDDKEKLTKPEPIAPEPEPEINNPVFNEWHKTNDWYLKDPDLTDFANLHAQRINPEGGMDAGTLYTEVEKKVKELFPHKFSNPNRENLSTVDTPSQLGGEIKPTGKSYADLPADAKKQCNTWVKDGTFKSREAYVKSYFEEE